MDDSILGPGEHQGRGSCLCGAVKFTTDQMSSHVGACHCGMCRKWGGGPFMEVNCGSHVAIEGASAVNVYDSSKWAERGFCKYCGTHLFYRLKVNQEYMMPVGLFDDDSFCEFDHQVFVDKQPAYYRFANNTEDMTEADVIAMFAPAES